MSMQLAAGVLASSLAVAPAEPVQAPVVPDNWTAAPVSAEVIRRAVYETIQEEKARAVAASKAAAIPEPLHYGYAPQLSSAERLSLAFDDAKVPGCLTPSGLKRQNTLIFGGVLALPFIPIAYLRGKCN